MLCTYSWRQLPVVVLSLTADTDLWLDRQPELMLHLEAVFSFISSWRQISGILALLMTASSFCLDGRQHEQMLHSEGVFGLLSSEWQVLVIVMLLSLARYLDDRIMRFDQMGLQPRVLKSGGLQIYIRGSAGFPCFWIAIQEYIRSKLKRQPQLLGGSEDNPKYIQIELNCLQIEDDLFLLLQMKQSQLFPNGRPSKILDVETMSSFY